MNRKKMIRLFLAVLLAIICYPRIGLGLEENVQILNNTSQIFYELDRSLNIDQTSLKEMIKTITTDKQVIKANIKELTNIQKDLESDVTVLHNCLKNVATGNYVLLGLEYRSGGSPRIRGYVISKDKYIEMMREATFDPGKNIPINRIFENTEFIKLWGQSHLSRIENLLADTKKWSTYYADELGKPARPSPEGIGVSPGASTASSSYPPDTRTLVFIVEVYDARKENQLVENAEVSLRLCKVKPSKFPVLWADRFATVKTPSGKAKFTIPADTLTNICSVKVRHSEYEEGSSAISQDLLVLSNEPRRYVVFLKPKKMKGVDEGVKDFSWELTEKIVDPDKMAGKAIGGGNVVKSIDESSVTLNNDISPGTKHYVRVRGSLPATLTAGMQFEISIDASCETEKEYCCIEGGIYTENLDRSSKERIGGCGKGVNKTQRYRLSAPYSAYAKLVVIPFAGGIGPLVKYVYTKKAEDASTTGSAKAQSSISVPTMEQDSYRPGSDYTSFDLSEANPSRCRNACATDVNCRAYTYMKPGVQGPKARCWLKNGVPAASKHSCCISGVKY